MLTHDKTIRNMDGMFHTSVKLFYMLVVCVKFVIPLKSGILSFVSEVQQDKIPWHGGKKTVIPCPDMRNLRGV